LLRLAAAVTAGVRGYEGIDSASAPGQIVLNVLAMAAGLLLALGLWTPVIGCLMAVFGAWYAVSLHEHLWSGVLLATVGASLALIGPGAWSIDARLFGWRRIDVRDRTDRE
jgi:putative oxidoreductase